MNTPLEDDHHCFVCGERNPRGLHLRFSLNGEKVFAEFIPRKIHQGYKDIVHGGILSTLLDEAMVKAALLQGMPSVTAEMTVRFKQPLHVGERILIEASLSRKGRKILEAFAKITKDDDTLIAEGSAKLLRQGA